MSQTATMPDWMTERLAGTAGQPGEVELAPDEVAAVTLFLALGTQWQRHPMSGVFLGLNYASIPTTTGMMDIAMDPQLFGDLQIMEQAALDALAQRPRR